MIALAIFVIVAVLVATIVIAGELRSKRRQGI